MALKQIAQDEEAQAKEDLTKANKLYERGERSRSRGNAPGDKPQASQHSQITLN